MGLEATQDVKVGTQPSSQLRTDSDGFFWLQVFGMAFLTFNSVMAIKRSINEPWNVAFVVFSYLDLVLLFYCLHVFEKTPNNSPRRGPLKVAVWSLSTTLTVMFSYKVAAIMPIAMKIAVWLMAGSSIGTGFYAFFIYKDTCCQAAEVEHAADKV